MKESDVMGIIEGKARRQEGRLISPLNPDSNRFVS